MRNFIVFLILCLVIIGVCYLNYYFMMTMISKHEERASFGDMFGVANAIFSGLGYAGLVYTILLQHKSISMQQQEQKDAQASNRESQEAISEQLTSMRRTNKISALSTLVGIYSEDESRYFSTDKSKSEESRLMKKKLLDKIEEELKSI